MWRITLEGETLIFVWEIKDVWVLDDANGGVDFVLFVAIGQLVVVFKHFWEGFWIMWVLLSKKEWGNFPGLDLVRV